MYVKLLVSIIGTMGGPVKCTKTITDCSKSQAFARLLTTLNITYTMHVFYPTVAQAHVVCHAGIDGSYTTQANIWKAFDKFMELLLFDNSCSLASAGRPSPIWYYAKIIGIDSSFTEMGEDHR